MPHDIEVEAFLADSVASAEGKLYVHGAGWNTIYAAAMPVHHDRIGIGLIVHVPYTATNQQHALTIRLEDEDGTVLPLGNAPGAATEDGMVREIGTGFNVGRPPTIQAGDEQLVGMAININGLRFERLGAYRFVVSVGGEDLKLLRFRVASAPGQTGPILR